SAACCRTWAASTFRRSSCFSLFSSFNRSSCPILPSCSFNAWQQSLRSHENKAMGSTKPWVQLADGVALNVRLTPRSGRDAIEGVERRSDGRTVLKAEGARGPVGGEAQYGVGRVTCSATRTSAGADRDRGGGGGAHQALAHYRR